MTYSKVIVKLIANDDARSDAWSFEKRCWVLSLQLSAGGNLGKVRCDTPTHQVRHTKPRRCLQKRGLKRAFGEGLLLTKFVDLAS